MAEPPILDGGVNCIMPPVLIGVTTKLVGAPGTWAWATFKHVINKIQIKQLCKLAFKILVASLKLMYMNVLFEKIGVLSILEVKLNL